MKNFLILVAMLTFGSFVFAAEPSALKVGDKAPLFAVKTIMYNDFVLTEKIKEAKEKKGLIVLDFWATWCAPCKREFPIFQKIYKELESKNVQFCAVSIDEKRSDLWKYAHVENTWEFQIAHDPNAFNAGKKYGADKLAPQLYIIDGDGVIRFAHEGEIKNLEEALKSQIEALMPGSFPKNKGVKIITGESASH
jgi:thiol-disulfide isomerase/thioredoxin